MRFSSLLALILVCFLPIRVLAQDNKELVQVKDQSINPNLKAQKFTDWTYRCSYEDSADEQQADKSCELSQAVMVGEGDNQSQILNFSLAKADDKAGKVKWALIALTPLDVHLPSDFGLQFGKTQPVITRFRNCNQLGCWVVIPATNKIISNMKRYGDGFGAFRLLNGQAIKVKFSLLGFTKAFSALEQGVDPDVNASFSPVTENDGVQE